MDTGTTEPLSDKTPSAGTRLPSFPSEGPGGCLVDGRPVPRFSHRLPGSFWTEAGGPAPICPDRWRPLPLADRWSQVHPTTVAPGGNLSPGYRAAKRLFDVIGALALVLVLGPPMVLTFLVLLVTTRGRPLFWQRRVGYRGHPFLMCKFRTMVPDAAGRQHEVRNEMNGPVFKNRRDPRVTRIGRLLRKTSLDETPQLFHVLFGRMSLVGPRPLPVDQVARLSPWQRGRLGVMPGLTCLWQTSGRCEIDFDQWMRLDLWYVCNQSFWTDLKLVLRTPTSVLSGRGAY